MRKKLLCMALVAAMSASMLVGCGESSSNGGSSSNSNSSSNKESGDKDSSGGGDTTASGLASDGKVLNIYCWNEEFKDRIKLFYDGYQETDATHGKIGDVEVVWNITPNENSAYQNNLDTQLLKQKDASADDKIDLFLAEADYILKYVDSSYTAAVSDLGLTDADLSKQYKYTQDVATDSSGKLKGVSWQSCPGVLFYNRAAAKEVLGSDDPAKVQEAVKDWAAYNETAKKMKDKGYMMQSTAIDSFRVYSNNVSSPWVVDNKINIDANIDKWVDDAKALVDAKYTTSNDLWSDEWKKGFYPEGKVFCYFGPAWLINFCMAADDKGSLANTGGWGATEGPQGFFWGGTWICATSDTDNAELVKDIMLKLTTDDEVMEKIAKEQDDFVNNQPVMEKLAESDYKSKVLGGQNPLAIYGAGVSGLDLSNLGKYDLTCTEEFQKAMKNYFNGNSTKDEALEMFKKAVVEKHPELSY